MKITDLLSLNNIKSISIEKERIISTEFTSANEKIINMNLVVQIIYNSEDNMEDPQVITVGEYIKKWLYNIKLNELKPSSFDRIEQTVTHQILPYIGDIPLIKLRSDDIQDMINTLRNKYSYSTIKKTYEGINSCLKYALRKHDVNYNAAECVVIPKNMEKSKNDIHFFTAEETEKIKNESVSCYRNGKRIYRLGELIIFLVNTGLRIGEALALKWSDIDLKKQTVNVRGNVVYVKKRDKDSPKETSGYNWKEQSTTKTRSGSRIVPLNSEAIRALISLKGINGRYDFVFSNAKGNRIYARNVDRMFRAILKRCSIAPTGVHTLRHTFASCLFAKGVDVKTVSELLGHSEIGITYDTYIHLIQEQHIVAVETLEEVL